MSSRTRLPAVRALPPRANPSAARVEPPVAGAADELVAWVRAVCAEPDVGNLVARAVPQESEQSCYRYPPLTPDPCERKVQIRVANCGSRAYEFIDVTEVTEVHHGNSELPRVWRFDGISAGGVTVLPVPVAAGVQLPYAARVNRPSPPEHHYRVSAGAEGSAEDGTHVAAIVRDPAFETAQKQYCAPLPDHSADGASVREPAEVPPKDVVELALVRTACFGYCPAYSIHLRTDGTVIYEGRSNVRVERRVFDRVAPAGVLALVAQFDAAEAEAPVRRDPRLHCSRGNADAPRTRVTLRRHGREWPMSPLGHCAPPHERELADEIDRVAQSERWLTGSKECRDRGLW